jgi:flagellar hook assembly protein FlgD
MARPADVDIVIYDLKGAVVWAGRLNRAETSRGVNYIIWNAENGAGIRVSNGIYILEIQADDRIVRKKIAVVK